MLLLSWDGLVERTESKEDVVIFDAAEDEEPPEIREPAPEDDPPPEPGASGR